MSKFDELIKVSIAKVSDADRIRRFVEEQIGREHIYSKNPDFFLYEFGNGESLNILIAEELSTEEICAIYAYYIYSDCNGEYDMAGGISLVSRDCGTPLVGTALYEKLKEFYSVRSIVSVGMKKNTSFEINRRRKDTYLGSLSQFYMLSGKGQYKIASIIEENVLSETEPEQKSIIPYKDVDQMYASFDESCFVNRLPYKSRKYINHRYFNHPIYKYNMYGMGDNLVLVCREVSANGGKALRIVDILGEVSNIRYLGNALKSLMDENGYEYIDLMEFGMDEADILAAGFTKLELTGANIIPNYFEPFVQKNIEILCCASLQPALIFKADADQDRPSIIR